MDNKIECAGGVQATAGKRAEIDTRHPFRSVKEAVSLFGDRILAPDLNPNNLVKQPTRAKENGHSRGASRLAELEETKQRLERAKEETMVMANSLSSLQQELGRTKKELQQLKELQRHESDYNKQALIEYESQINKDVQIVRQDYSSIKSQPTNNTIKEADHVIEFQKKKHVERLERHPSLRYDKKKPLIPLFGLGGIFSKRKLGRHDAATALVTGFIP